MNVKIVLLICFLGTSVCRAQWLNDVRLTNSPSVSSTSYSESIAVTGDVIHVTWYDNRSGEYQIFYKASADAGATWSPDARLIFTSSGAYYPCIKVSGPVVHVVWTDYRNESSEIYYKRSTNGGFTWGADLRLSNASQLSESPTITVAGGIVHVAWHDWRNENYEIYYRASADGGATWSPEARLTNDPSSQQLPSISVSGPDVHLAWMDFRNGGRQIYYKRSTNGGFSWGADTRISWSTGLAQFPSITSTGDIVHLAWFDNRDGNNEIYYSASGNRGINWSPEGRLTNNSSASEFPSIYVSGPFVHLVWRDTRDGNTEIYYKFSSNGGFSWGGDTRITSNPSGSHHPSVFASLSKVHVLWTDTRDENEEIYYKCNPTGNPISINNMSTETPKEFSLSQNYPNPFNPITNIKFSIPHASFVKLTVYDITGREVTSLINQQLNTGVYKVDFDASHLSSGIYLYRIDAESFFDVKKMMLIK